MDNRSPALVRWLTAPLVFWMACLCTTAVAQEHPALVIDASDNTPVASSSYQGGSSATPDGHTLGLNDRYLLRDGHPWLPVMGEFHYSRVPETEWEDEILKMKSAGVSIVSTYVIWIHHEEIEGHFDWTGRRDLRRFVALCAKHGMLVYLRIGPWAHGEVRNGGFPDWLLAQAPANRRNDPTYLRFVARFYGGIGREVAGQLWKDGGPVVGVQLENEYNRKGEGAGEAHILELKRLAIVAGLDVPLYSVTGWDGAWVPHGDVVAMFGGYPDAPWDASLRELPAQEVYMFRFGSRVTGDMGAIGAQHGHAQSSSYDYPFMTAEMGGGIQDTYHRRPVLQPDDVAAMVPVMLGSGANLYGSYMFQGGENPDGQRSTFEESQRTGYPNDVPTRSYDFQAPLGEFGQEREVLRKLKVFNYFMQTFGDQLAPMQSYAPTVRPSAPDDLAEPRVALRANHDSGFLFFNNYVRNRTMPARHGFQVEIKLPGGSMRVPERPVEMPSGVYGVWPVGMRVGGARLRYATAQPLTRLVRAGRETMYFVATPGVPAEFAFDGGAHVFTHGRTTVTRENNGQVLLSLRPSLAPGFTVEQANSALDIVLLTQQQAEEAWRVPVSDLEASLVLTPDDVFSDGANVALDRRVDARFSFTVTPPVNQAPVSAATLRLASREGSTHITASLAERRETLHLRRMAAAGPAAPVRTDPPGASRHGIATTPDESAFDAAEIWQLAVPTESWRGVQDLFLRIRYRGDIARLTVDDRLLADDFYNGQVWEVGLRRFRAAAMAKTFRLEILPLPKSAPIFLEGNARETAPKEGGTLLRGVDLVPEYRLRFALPPSSPQLLDKRSKSAQRGLLSSDQSIKY